MGIKKIIPARYHYLLANFKNTWLGGYRKTHYSQFGEDIVLQSIFRNKKTGFYVDVGAHHPTRYSNTALLYKKGWRGINIDPNPESIQLFKKARPLDINLCLGASKNETELNYYTFSDPAINTFVLEEAEKWIKQGKIPFLGKKKIMVQPLAKILALYLPENLTIDMLSIDTEGMDDEVLESNDWQKYAPNVIVVENHCFNLEKPETNSVYNFLRKKQYALYSLVGPSLIFVKHK